MLDKAKIDYIARKEYKLLFAAQRLNHARRTFEHFLTSFDVYLMETPACTPDETLPNIAEFYAKRENMLVIRKELDLLGKLEQALKEELHCYEDFMKENSAFRQKPNNN